MLDIKKALTAIGLSALAGSSTTIGGLLGVGFNLN